MINQVSSASVLPALLVSVVGVAAVAIAILHGILRTFMHERGVEPWTLRDTVGSSGLVIVGAAFWGASIGLLLAGVPGTGPGATRKVTTIVFACLGLLAIRLGLLSLRKLT